jgi:protein-S-isoprenylcysteine O-methyltransferase Ste14
VIGRLASAAIFAGICYVVPLWGRWELFRDPRPALAILVAMILIAAQPVLDRREVRRTREADRGTAPLIMLASLATQLATTLEWRLRPDGAESWTIAALGVALVLAGLVLRLHAIWILGRRFTATVQVAADHQLIEDGAYRFVRHPSYLGALITIVGMAVMFRAWLAAPASAVLMGAVYHRRIRLEERALEAALGAPYRSYRERTWALLPGLW